MQTSSPVQVGPEVQKFTSKEVHITGKTGSPVAILVFVATDNDGTEIHGVAPIVIELRGEAYADFYDGWDTEKELYEKAISCSALPGGRIAGGADVLAAIGGIETLKVPDVVEEVLPETESPAP